MAKRFAITPDVGLKLAEMRAVLPKKHALVSSVLLRPQIQASLFAAVRDGDLTQTEALARMEHLRGCKIRMLGDKTLQRTAWEVAMTLNLKDTYEAEYIAAAKLQADALVTLEPELIVLARRMVTVAELQDLLENWI